MQRAAASSPNSKVETAAIKAATDSENARREAATLALRPAHTSDSLDRDSETRWELSYVSSSASAQQGLKVASVGFSQLGAESESEEEEEEEQEKKDEEEKPAPAPATPVSNGGRLVFGNFRRTPLEATPVKNEDDDSDSENETPKKHAVSLRGLTSISNAGNQAAANMTCNTCAKRGHRAAECPRSECYACGGLGHMSSDCPNPGSAGRGKRKEAGEKRGGDRGGDRKKRRSM